MRISTSKSFLLLLFHSLNIINIFFSGWRFFFHSNFSTGFLYHHAKRHRRHLHHFVNRNMATVFGMQQTKTTIRKSVCGYIYKEQHQEFVLRCCDTHSQKGILKWQKRVTYFTTNTNNIFLCWIELFDVFQAKEAMSTLDRRSFNFLPLCVFGF